MSILIWGLYYLHSIDFNISPQLSQTNASDLTVKIAQTVPIKRFTKQAAIDLHKLFMKEILVFNEFYTSVFKISETLRIKVYQLKHLYGDLFSISNEGCEINNFFYEKIKDQRNPSQSDLEHFSDSFVAWHNACVTSRESWEGSEYPTSLPDTLMDLNYKPFAVVITYPESWNEVFNQKWMVNKPLRQWKSCIDKKSIVNVDKFWYSPGN